MIDSIVLFTKKYPFDAGETFIENEIGILANNFKSVVVVATATSKKDVQTRALPSNVVVYKLCDIQNIYLRYAFYIFVGLLKCSNRQVFDELKKANGIKAKLGVFYIAARTSRLINKVKKNADIIDKILKSNTVLYSYWFSDLPIVTCRLKKYFQNIPLYLVSRAHGYDLYAERNITNYIPFRDYVMREIDRVFPCSENGTLYLKKLYPQYLQKVKTAYLGTLDWGISDGKKDDKYHIVTCSSIIPLKRVVMVAEALKILETEKKITNIRWTCIGDGNLFNKLKIYVEKYIHNISVELKGQMSNVDVINYYKKNYVDLFINVSTSEGLPVSIMEAQSFGIPTLATDVGGTSEIVSDGLTGKLLPADVNANILAGAIENMMGCNFDRRTIRKFWEEHFNANVNYKKFIDEIEKIAIEQ